MKINPGDKIKCITGLLDYAKVTVGKTYEVEHIKEDKSEICIKNDKGQYVEIFMELAQNHFELVQKEVYCHSNEKLEGSFTVGKTYKVFNDPKLGDCVKTDDNRTYSLDDRYDKHLTFDKPYDYINPSHYQSGSKEVWEMMVDIWGKEKYIAHCEMCAFKYRMRLGMKPNQPVERDLEKAKWYEDKAKELKQV